MKKSLPVKALTLCGFAFLVCSFIAYRAGYFADNYPEAFQGSHNGGNVTGEALQVPSKKSQDSIKRRQMLSSSKVVIVNDVPISPRDTVAGRYSSKKFSADTLPQQRELLFSSKSMVAVKLTFTDTIAEPAEKPKARTKQ